MTYAIVSIHTPNFKELSDVTWPNKVEYANRHSYKSQAKTDGFLLEHASGEKIPFIREYLKANPDANAIEIRDAVVPCLPMSTFYDTLDRFGISYKKKNLDTRSEAQWLGKSL
jgi:hypothetical protein